MKDSMEYILSIGLHLSIEAFRFDVSYTTHLKQVISLRIFNITWKEQTIYNCYYGLRNGSYVHYTYSIQLANVTNSLIKKQHGTVCCVVKGHNIKTANYLWEQRTLFDEHVRFIYNFNINDSEKQQDKPPHLDNDSQLMSCMKFHKPGILAYNIGGTYICTAQLFLYGRRQMISRTTSLKIENIQDRPLCINDIKRQHYILGDNITIIAHFYSKPQYLSIVLRKNENIKLENSFTVFKKTLILEIFQVTVMIISYEITVNVPEFREEDIGNYTVNITNEFGSCLCEVQILLEDITIQTYPTVNVLEGQSVIFICQSISKKTTNNFSWTKHGVVVSNSSSIMLQKVTQGDNGNYTCRMNNNQKFLTKNEVLVVRQSVCTHGFLEMKSVLSFGTLAISLVLLMTSVICNICIHRYYKKIARVSFATDGNNITEEGMEMIETENAYHTINEEQIRLDDTETENTNELSSSFREISNVSAATFPVVASGRTEQLIEEEDYLNPYCTMMQSTIDVHEYRVFCHGAECDGTDDVSNQALGRLYENLKI
ncbi:uncharacterized protein LOC134683526 [Mytilus trossulus]|uniref:uncharacterized protein LOC134683526 n=1 Tax=Mytilus trossulus TaxID=6551 RepID=UPI0030062DF0